MNPILMIIIMIITIIIIIIMLNSGVRLKKVPPSSIKLILKI